MDIPLRDLVFANNGTSDVLRQLSCFHHCVKEVGNNVAFTFLCVFLLAFYVNYHFVILLFCIKHERSNLFHLILIFFRKYSTLSLNFIGANNTGQDCNLKMTMHVYVIMLQRHPQSKEAFLPQRVTDL